MKESFDENFMADLQVENEAEEKDIALAVDGPELDWDDPKREGYAEERQERADFYREAAEYPAEGPY